MNPAQEEVCPNPDQQSRDNRDLEYPKRDYPDLEDETIARIKFFIARNPDPEAVQDEEDYIALISRLIEQFGFVAGVFAWKLFSWTGKSHRKYGWLYKSREELEQPTKQGTGQGHREQEKARAILRGEKPWNGRRVCVLQEWRPFSTAPTHFRLDLFELAGVLGVELPEDLSSLRRVPPQGATVPPHGAATKKLTKSTDKETSKDLDLTDRRSASPPAPPTPQQGEEILEDSSTSTLPLWPDVESDSANEESTSAAPPLSPEAAA